ITMSLFFTRSIISRLEILVDNTRRLKTGEALRPRVSGDDEIAQLDRVFHTMANELRESARKERQALSDATEAESRIRQIINSMPVGLFISDKAGTILFANPIAGELIGYSTNDLKGMPLVQLFPQYKPSLADGVDSLFRELTDKSVETVVRKKGGQGLDIELSMTPFDRGDDKRFLITYQDVSERIEMQRMRQSFVAMVSHDLRTPLNSVQGVLELLEMGALGEISSEARESVERASKNVERLVGLINDLLDLEKMESGTISIHCTTGAVDGLFDRAVQAVGDLADKRGVRISKKCNETMIFCDFDRTLQVMVNLLGNAIRHSPDNGEIFLEASQQNNSVEISVIDEGPGVPEEYRQAIFERYQQVPGKESGGTGLGLAICKAILSQHGSNIAVKDAFPEGKPGSKFSFTLAVGEPVKANSS
ncbi:MAG: PAS domain S-box protein, partial [Cyanobacteria bacterium]|nr:PAS domain S-box protein [Cyanobacteriota bacterium]